MSQPSRSMKEFCAVTVAELFSLYPTLAWLARPNHGWYSQITLPVQPEYMSCRMRRFETWPAGELGTSVSDPELFALVLKPSKNAKQYGRFPPGSLAEEQVLVLFDSCCNSVPMGTGGGGGAGPPPFVPPASVEPEAIAVKEAFTK